MIPDRSRAFLKARPRLDLFLWNIYRHPRHLFLLMRRMMHVRVDKKTDDSRLWVNVGGGTYFRRHWRVLDYFGPGSYHHPRMAVDYPHDLATFGRFPFADGSVHAFYTSHTLEHIPQEFCQHILGEMYRCLRPGGALRITVPDLEKGAEAYRRNDIRFFEMSAGGDLTEKFLDFFATWWRGKVGETELRRRLDATTLGEFGEYYTSRVPREEHTKTPGNHINWWTHEKALSMLRSAGFREPYRSTPQGSRFPEMRGEGRDTGFDSTHPHASLFVEAMK